MTAQAQDLKPILEYPGVAAHVSPWISRISDFQGGLSITLDIKGSLDNPNLKGKVELEDFQCRVAGFGLPLRKINGSMRFRGTGVTFSSVKGAIGDSAAEISGSFSPEGMHITGDMKLLPTDLKKLNAFGGDWSMSGAIPASISAKGTTGSFNFVAGVDLKANSVTIGRFLRKQPGTPLKVEASGSVNSDGVTVEDAYLILDNIRISAKANVNNSGGFTAFVNLPPKGIPTSALVPVADPSLEIQPGGRVEGDFVLRSGPEKPREISVDSNILVNYVSMHLPFFYRRTEGLTGTIRRRGKSSTSPLTELRWAVPLSRHRGNQRPGQPEGRREAGKLLPGHNRFHSASRPCGLHHLGPMAQDQSLRQVPCPQQRDRLA